MTEHLNFEVWPRLDPTRGSTLPFIPVNESLKTVEVETKWAILVHVTELGYKWLSVKDKAKLGQAVTRFHTYIGGYPTHLGLPSTFLK